MVDYNQELIQRGIDDGRKTLPRHKSKVWDPRASSILKGMVYHQSLEDYGTASGNAAYHVGPNHLSDTGLPGLSYTMFVEKSGKIILANDVEDKTWSQGDRDLPGDENAEYMGVCFGGNFSGPGYDGPQTPTEAQLNSATLLWEIVSEIWSFDNNCLFGHYDFGKPSCPGYVLAGLIESVNRGVTWERGGFDLSTAAGRQQALKELDFFKDEVNGEWGPSSRYALTMFQRSVGLNPDGVFGKQTATALLQAL